ncbi:MAG: enoyl-CoA hydratase/isomerase family protein [Flavobacteriales bacterium]|nr:enoyl-CoA hydratase/isomerase family protein [Flavobacteriales bacterium]
MNRGYVKVEVKNGVGEIEFFHPKSNSLPAALLQEITEGLNKLSENNEVLVIHLKSRGEKAFCAGASFDELLKVSNEEEGKEFFSGFARVILAIKNAPKFVVAQIQSKVVGGGVGIVAACDFVVATDQASLKLSELSIGIGPFVVGPAVERKIGLAHFTNMSLNPTAWKTANWGKEIGLYSEVVSSTVELEIRLKEMITLYKTYSPEAMLEIKKMLWEKCFDMGEVMSRRAEKSGSLVLSDFTRNKLEEFKLK